VVVVGLQNLQFKTSKKNNTYCSMMSIIMVIGMNSTTGRSMDLDHHDNERESTTTVQGHGVTMVVKGNWKAVMKFWHLKRHKTEVYLALGERFDACQYI
jgi:hypothetical protein